MAADVSEALSGVPVKGDIAFALLGRAAVDPGIQTADLEALLQIEAAGGQVVVLSLEVEAP